MTTTTSHRIEGSGQQVDYTEHLTLDNGGRKGRHTLRVLLHIDSYVAQAWGRVERHDGVRWHEVASLKGCSLATDLKIGYTKGTGAKTPDFATDRNTLVKLAEEVL
jgi:hypothetical protein